MKPGTPALEPFPDPRRARPDGLVAIGGDFRAERLLLAYAQGIFPWPHDELAHAWFSPDPRFVLRPEEMVVSRSLRKTLRREPFEVTFDTAFEQVIHACAGPRPRQDGGTWIQPELIDGYLDLHELGFAHSVESWSDGELVGGIYGVSIGAMFSGDSMFYHRPEASKVALCALIDRMRRWDFHFLDCQTPGEHMARFGAREQPRDEFLAELAGALRAPTRRGPWSPGRELS